MLKIFSNLPIWVKGLLSLISAILIGSMGSGLWDLAFKGLFLGLGNSIFDSFLGISKAFEDRIYIQIARGNRGALINLTFFYVMILFTIAYIIIISYLNNARKKSLTDLINIINSSENMRIKILETKSSLLEMIDNKEAQHNEESQTLIEDLSVSNALLEVTSMEREIDKDISEMKLKAARRERSIARGRWGDVVIVGAIFTSSFISYATNDYIDQKILDYNVAFDISRPFVSDLEAYNITAKYRSVSSRGEYERLIDNIKARLPN